MSDTATPPSAGQSAQPTQSMQYVYAVLRAQDAASQPPPGVHGIGDAPVGLVQHAGLAALTSPVPAEEFDEAGLRRNLEDLDWLERTARAHQGVVAGAAQEAGVLPLRLTTVCRDEAGVRRLLDEGRPRFDAALEALSGRVEWGVKVFADNDGREAAARAPGQHPAPETRSGGADGTSRGRARSAPAAGAGRAYLRQRSTARRASEERAVRSDAAARRVHSALSGLADRTRLHRPQHPRLSGVTAENLLNAAYLVPQEHAGTFAERVRALAEHERDVRIELTGPWAPYSFAEAVTEDADDTAVRT